MRPENETNDELQQLLDSLEEHGKNARRQKELGELIDRHYKLYPLRWALSAAAACLLLWLLVKPNMKQQPEMEQEILVEETRTVDSVKPTVKDVVFEEPVVSKELLAEEKPVVPKTTPTNKIKPKAGTIEEVVENTLPTEQLPTEQLPTEQLPTEQLPTEQLPRRRVIQSLNLVCFECQTENGERKTENFPLSTLHFPLPKDPNMKNGSLAFEIKLN